MIDFGPLNAACLSAFGQVVTYTPAGGASVAMTAIRAERGEPEATDPGSRVWCWFRESDFAAAPEFGDALTVGGVGYKVERIDADEEGGLVLWGRKA